MGRGLSDQQRAILIWAYEHGEPLADPITRTVVLGIGRTKTEEYQGDGVWTIKVRDQRVNAPWIKNGEYMPSFGHEPGWDDVKSNVERASVARSLSRLEARGLIDRFNRGGIIAYLILRPEGFDLAKSLVANG